MTTGNRPTRASCALSAIAASLLVLAVSCGGSGRHAPKPQSASQLVGQALGGRAAVRSGQVELSLSLLAPSAREVFVLHSATRFRLGAPGATPDLTMTLATLSHSGSGPSAGAAGGAGLGSARSLAQRPGPPRPRQPAGPARAAGRLRPADRRPGGWGRRGGAARSRRGRLADGAPLRDGGGRTVCRGVRTGPPKPPTCARASRWRRSWPTWRGWRACRPRLEQASGRVGRHFARRWTLSKAALAESGAGTVDLYADPRSRLPRRLVASVNLHPGSGAGGHSSPPVSVSLRMSFTALGEPAPTGSS